MAHDIVIIYSKADKATAEAVCHRLERAGIRCWIAPRDNSEDRSQDDAIVQALGASKLAVMVVSSPADPARQIMTTALDAEIMIIPFRAEIQSPSHMISRKLHWLDMLSDPLDARIRQLIDRVASQLSGQETRPAESSVAIDAIPRRPGSKEAPPAAEGGAGHQKKKPGALE